MSVLKVFFIDVMVYKKNLFIFIILIRFVEQLLQMRFFTIKGILSFKAMTDF